MDDYARHARLYDPLLGSLLRPVHRAMLDALPTASQTVLDLCCGTGLLAGMAAQAGKQPTGLDLSPAMLDVARNKHPGLGFIRGDATSLPFPDHAFDAATICFALHEKPLAVAEDMLAQARRVTRPDGRILVADYRVTQSAPFTGLLIRLVERLAGRDHFRHFTEYMRAGGTHALLDRTGLIGTEEQVFHHGRTGLFVIRNR